ncbi:MAG: tetratricopeptide repeat protein [Phycisphaerae bacterium]
MNRNFKHAKANFRFLVTLGVIVFLIGVGGYAAQRIRKQVLSSRALTAGQTAFAKEDWSKACLELGKYLSRNPFDPDVLKKYAYAQLSVQPLESANIGSAISVYRRLMNIRPEDETVYKELARLYMTVGDFSELAFIANKRLEKAPDDLEARMWLAQSLVMQKKYDKGYQNLSIIVKKSAKKPEVEKLYVKACVLLGRMAMENKNRQIGFVEGLKWLNLAVENAPKSSEALVGRAQFYRLMDIGSEEANKRNLDLARVDLARADALGDADPQTRLTLCSEWMEHGDLKLAAAELDAMKKIDPKTLREFVLDPDSWTVALFTQSAALAVRMGNIKEGVLFADDTMSRLKSQHQRKKALPSAVLVYSYGGKATEARRCLDEYLEIVKGSESKGESIGQVALLKAMVAQVEGKPYQVIECLEPVAPTDESNASIFRLLARAYSQTDQNRRAIRALRQCLRLTPQDRQVMTQLIKEYLKGQNFGKALELSRLTEKMDPSDLTIKLLRIEIIAYGNTEKSPSDVKAIALAVSKELTGLRKQYPDKMEIRLLQASLAQETGRVNEAEKELKLTIREFKNSLDAQLQLARLYFSSNRIADAVEVLKESCKRHPTALAPWELLVRYQQISRKIPEARQTLQAGIQAVTGEWNKSVLRTKLAFLVISQEDRKAGIDMLKKLALENPQDVNVRILLLDLPETRQDMACSQKIIEELQGIQGQTGLLWRIAKASFWMDGKEWRTRQQDIVTYLQRCIDADPEWSRPVLLLGQLYERLGSFSRTEAIYRKALSDNPSAVDVADRLITLLDRQKRYDEVMKVLSHVSASSQAISNRRTYSAIQAGDLNQAIDELKLRIAGDPKDVNALVLMARIIYQQTRNPAAAFEYLDQAEKLDPKAFTIKAVRIAILTSEKRLDEARKILDDQIRTKNNFEAYLLRAGFLAEIGKITDAEKDYQHLTTISGKEGYDLLGTFYISQKKFDEAVLTWEQAVKTFPDNLVKKRNLMKALFLRNKPGDKKQAEELLRNLAVKLPDDPDILSVRAELLLNENNPGSKEKAQELLEKVIQIDPSAAEAHLTLVNMAFQKRDLTSARELAIHGLEANPHSSRLLVVRAAIERELNNPDLALELTRMALREEPENRTALLMFSEISLTGHNASVVEEAKTLAREALKKNPADEQLQLTNMMLLSELGQRDEAFMNLKTFSQTPAGQKSVAVNLAMASLCRLRQDYVQAEKYLQQASDLAPQSPQVLQERIILMGDQKKFDEVTKVISSYRSKPDKDNSVIFVAASVLSSSANPNDIREAKSLLESLNSVSPKMPMVKKSLAHIMFLLGEYDQAERLFREMLQDQPNDAQIMNDLAWLLSDARHRYKDALPLVEQALRIDTENIHFYDTRGVIFLNLPGRMDDARKDFEQCVRLAPPDSAAKARALWQLGKVLAKLGNTAKSREVMETALQIDAKVKVFGATEKKDIAEILKTVPVGNNNPNKG